MRKPCTKCERQEERVRRIKKYLKYVHQEKKKIRPHIAEILRDINTARKITSEACRKLKLLGGVKQYHNYPAEKP